jgi:hypothetical protein
MKWIFLLCMTISAFVPDQKTEPDFTLPDINTALPLQWQADIGAGSYRTNVVCSGNQLYIGSNGRSFMDANLFDSKGGVYTLNPKTGKIAKQFANEVPGDMDVNGLLAFENMLYFGNDNEEILCTDLEGREIWRKPVSGDVESQPVLLDISGRKAIVFATEVGEIQAVNPQNGNTVWAHYTPEFNGWKPGQNRKVMKVQAYFRNSESFVTRPIVSHLNGNGVEDLVYRTYDNRIYAVEGKTGNRLYQFDDPSYFLQAILDVQKRGKRCVTRCILKPSSRAEGEGMFLAEINNQGQISKKTMFKQTVSDFSVESTLVTKQGNVLLPLQNSILVISPDNTLNTIDRNNLLREEERKSTFSTYRSSYITRISTGVFRFGSHRQCIALLNQYDPLVREKGFLEIVDIEKKEVVVRLQLPDEGEMPPYIGDINGDGKVDLLVSGYGGKLYCYRIS